MSGTDIAYAGTRRSSSAMGGVRRSESAGDGQGEVGRRQDITVEEVLKLVKGKAKLQSLQVRMSKSKSTLLPPLRWVVLCFRPRARTCVSSQRWEEYGIAACLSEESVDLFASVGTRAYLILD
eukprot:2429878-Rhodomonas_salina.3